MASRGIGVNPYKILYTLVLAAVVWAAGFWPLEGIAGVWLLVFSYLLAHFSFVWFKKTVFGKIVVFDMGGVLTSGDFYTEEIRSQRKVVHLVMQLRRKYVTALLSNNNALFSHGARKILPMDAMFDYEFYTSMLGAKKPSEPTYLRFLNHVGMRPSQMVFVDDLEENVAAAKKLGICGIVYKNPQQLQECLAAYGIRP